MSYSVTVEGTVDEVAAELEKVTVPDSQREAFNGASELVETVLGSANILGSYTAQTRLRVAVNGHCNSGEENSAPSYVSVSVNVLGG